jgi:hypothetical protein
MKYKGGICYGKIPANVGWKRDIKFIPTSSLGSYDQESSILEASVVQISPDCGIELLRDANWIVTKAERRPVGWIRFDGNGAVDIGDLGCICVMQQKSNGWTKLSQDSWRGFACVSGNEQLDLNGLSYNLLVSNAAREQGYEKEVCRRLGVAVIQADCLTGEGKAVWVI